MRTRILLVAVAAMLSQPVPAQTAPPPVPQNYCDADHAPWDQIMAGASLATTAVGRMGMVTAGLRGWMRGCNQRYQIDVQRWQMEMQRWQLMNHR